MEILKNMSFNIPTMSPASSHAGRSRSNSYSSSVKELQAGTKVLIIETENVMQRARHLVGKVGSICEVPGIFISLSYFVHS